MFIIKRLIFIFLLCFFTSTQVFSKPTESTDYLDYPESTGNDVPVNTEINSPESTDSDVLASTDIDVPESTEINSPAPALETPIAPSQVKEDRDLLIYKRGRMPYYKQPFYDIYLENYSNTQSNKYPIRLGRHHIIPHNVFVSFFNTLVKNNNLDICGVLFDTISDNVPYYDIKYNKREVKTVQSIIQKLVLNEVVHKGNAQVIPEYTSFIDIYANLPGNLFYGPLGSDRSDDPKSGFEVNSKIILGKEYYDKLYSIYNNMNQYIATASEDSARFACYNLSEVAGYTEIYPVNSEAWELVNNKYNIIHK